MPKIRIREIDATGRVQQSAISNVVYLPIRLNYGRDGQLTRDDLTKVYQWKGQRESADIYATESIVSPFSNIVLFKSSKEFKDAAKSAVSFTSKAEDGGVDNIEYVSVIDEESLGYQLCVHLLNIGFEILVEALTDTSEPNWSALEDKNLYDIRFLTLGALAEDLKYTTVTDPDTLEIISYTKEEGGFDLTDQTQSMVSTAANRGDCIALLNAYEISPDFSYAAVDVRGQFEGIAKGGEYAAAFTPWFYTKNSDFYTTELLKKMAESEGYAELRDKGVKIPAAFGYLFAYANATKNNPEWYAMAGFERGIIPELSDVCHAYSTADVEVLQGRSATKEVELDDEYDNVGYAINPICYVRPAGNILYGNRTLKINDPSKKLVATSFLNIRNGLSAIKKKMYEASKKYTFEQNTETLWINFQSYITPLLDRMQAGNGILGYTFVKQKTDAKARLKARLNLIPVEAVEDFDLEVYLTDDLTVNE